MTYQEVASSRLLYILVIASLVIITGICIYYLVVCIKNARNLGISREKIREAIRSSALFSIMPSVAVAIGLLTLVVVIGTPYSWFRLSVIGSVAYELMASNMALDAMGLDLAHADAAAFGMIMWVMCIPISSSVIVNLFAVKPIHLGALNIGGSDKKWGALAMTVFMTSLICVLIIPQVFGGLVKLLTFITSALCAIALSVLAKKLNAKWLNDFILAFCLIFAMGMSVVYTNILG